MPERMLTEADIKAIAAAVQAKSEESGLTHDEVLTLKRFLKAFDHAAGIIGKTILSALVIFLIGIFTKGFWMQLAAGIKQGAGK